MNKYAPKHIELPDGRYKLLEDIHYWSPRYKKWISSPKGFISDGATGARDIDSLSWWVHDQICETAVFDDGTKITNWQASHILGDILISEGRWWRGRVRWFWSTWLFGCNKARKNGMW